VATRSLIQLEHKSLPSPIARIARRRFYEPDTVAKRCAPDSAFTLGQITRDIYLRGKRFRLLPVEPANPFDSRFNHQRATPASSMLQRPNFLQLELLEFG